MCCLYVSWDEVCLIVFFFWFFLVGFRMEILLFMVDDFFLIVEWRILDGRNWFSYVWFCDLFVVFFND